VNDLSWGFVDAASFGITKYDRSAIYNAMGLTDPTDYCGDGYSWGGKINNFLGYKGLAKGALGSAKLYAQSYQLHYARAAIINGMRSMAGKDFRKAIDDGILGFVGPKGVDSAMKMNGIANPANGCGCEN
jgi:hypothetical protein